MLCSSKFSYYIIARHLL